TRSVLVSPLHRENSSFGERYRRSSSYIVLSRCIDDQAPLHQALLLPLAHHSSLHAQPCLPKRADSRNRQRLCQPALRTSTGPPFCSNHISEQPSSCSIAQRQCHYR